MHSEVQEAILNMVALVKYWVGPPFDRHITSHADHTSDVEIFFVQSRRLNIYMI